VTFTTTELEKMVADYCDFAAQLLPNDAIQTHFPGHTRREISRTDAHALKSNAVQIAKQLLKVVQGKAPAGQYSEQVLETMIEDYETFWQEDSKGIHGGDNTANAADKLGKNILWITKELLAELLKGEGGKNCEECLFEPTPELCPDGCLNQRKLDLDRREAELEEREDQLRKNVDFFERERKRQENQKAGLQQRELALNRREIELVGIEDWAKLLEKREAAVTELEARLSTGK